jgi:hypothetical protein
MLYAFQSYLWIERRLHLHHRGLPCSSWLQHTAAAISCICRWSAPLGTFLQGSNGTAISDTARTSYILPTIYSIEINFWEGGGGAKCLWIVLTSCHSMKLETTDHVTPQTCFRSNLLACFFGRCATWPTVWSTLYFSVTFRSGILCLVKRCSFTFVWPCILTNFFIQGCW